MYTVLKTPTGQDTYVEYNYDILNKIHVYKVILRLLLIH